MISLVFLPTTSENLKPIGFSQCPPKMPDCCPMTKLAQDYVQWPPAPLLQFEVQKVWQFMHCWPAKVHFEFWGHHKMGKSSTCLKAKIANKKGSMLHQDTWYLLCIDIACKNPSGNSAGSFGDSFYEIHFCEFKACSSASVHLPWIHYSCFVASWWSFFLPSTTSVVLTSSICLNCQMCLCKL